MIVAGGRGTRLRPLTLTRPKPLVEFCGEPFLLSVMRRLADVGVSRLFLVVGEDTSPFDVLRGPGEELGVEVVAVPEPAPLDTAGGVRSVVDRVDGTFLVLNGDVLTDVDLRVAIEHHRRTGADATLVLTEVDDTSAFGVCVREGTRIVDFVEKPPPGSLPGQRGVNAGTYVLEPSVLLAHDEGRLSFERDVFPGVVARGGHLEGVVWDGAWADLGTPARFLEGTRLALDGALDWPAVRRVAETAPGIRVHDDAEVHPSATLTAPVLVREGAVVEEGATVGPHVVLGRDARIGAHTAVRDAVLFEEARIAPLSTASGCLLGVGSYVGSRVDVGAGAVLGDGVVIEDGTFVEHEARIPGAP